VQQLAGSTTLRLKLVFFRTTLRILQKKKLI
jgi:hypothetical protein